MSLKVKFFLDDILSFFCGTGSISIFGFSISLADLGVPAAMVFVGTTNSFGPGFDLNAYASNRSKLNSLCDSLSIALYVVRSLRRI